MAKKHLNKDISIGALLGALLVTAFTIVIPRLHMLSELSFGYYNLLPVAEKAADMDKDGIPNYIDDSDGDTIPDKYDGTPFPIEVEDEAEDGEENEDGEEEGEEEASDE